MGKIQPFIKGKQLLGVTCGSGLSAKQTEKGGADFLLVLNSAIYRQKGRSSLCGFLPLDNANELTITMGRDEILPITKDIPVYVGVCATDPTVDLEVLLNQVKQAGFEGVCNYPTVGLIDGQLSKEIANSPYSFAKEVELMALAKKNNLGTIGFVFDTEQAQSMLEKQVDVLCVHLGLTKGGLVGAKKALSLVDSKSKINQILSLGTDSSTIKMFFGGVIQTPMDIEFIYQNTDIEGYIAGSSLDRIPSEDFIVRTTEKFKRTSDQQQEQLLKEMLDGVETHYDPVEFVKKYINVNYMNDISFQDIADVAHISRSYLSTLFSQSVGLSFQDYLIKYRLNKAIQLMSSTSLKLQEIASLVGYENYTHFSKIFKLKIGVSPTIYRKSNKKTTIEN